MGILDEEEYEKIIDETKTGFEVTTDKGLINRSGSDITTGDRAKMEMDRRLKKEIQRFNINSSRQTKWIIRLTIAMLVVGIAQIGLLIYSFFT